MIPEIQFPVIDLPDNFPLNLSVPIKLTVKLEMFVIVRFRLILYFFFQIKVSLNYAPEAL